MGNRVRANVTLAVLAYGQAETDVILQGDEQFPDVTAMRKIILDTIREISPGDWIAILAVPLESGTGWFTPISWAGFRPTQRDLAKMNMFCDSHSPTDGKPCTLGALHKESDGDPTGGLYHVDDTGDIWE